MTRCNIISSEETGSTMTIIPQSIIQRNRKKKIIYFIYCTYLIYIHRSLIFFANKINKSNIFLSQNYKILILGFCTIRDSRCTYSHLHNVKSKLRNYENKLTVQTFGQFSGEQNIRQLGPTVRSAGRIVFIQINVVKMHLLIAP